MPRVPVSHHLHAFGTETASHSGLPCTQHAVQEEKAPFTRIQNSRNHPHESSAEAERSPGREFEVEKTSPDRSAGSFQRRKLSEEGGRRVRGVVQIRGGDLRGLAAESLTHALLGQLHGSPLKHGAAFGLVLDAALQQEDGRKHVAPLQLHETP